MFELGDEITYKNIRGVIIDLPNQIIFNGDKKIIISFDDAIYVDSLFDDPDDFELYLYLVEKITGELINDKNK